MSTERSPNAIKLLQDVALLDQLPLPAFVIRVDKGGTHCIEKFNRAMINAAGLEKHPDPGSKLNMCLPERWANKLEKTIRSCLEARSSQSFEEVHEIAGEEQCWKTTLTPVFDASDSPDMIIGLSENITKSRQRGKENAESLSMMSNRLNDLGLFSSVAAHDLRSPLCQLDLMLRLLLNEFEDLGDGKKEMLQTSREIVARGIGFLDEVLQYCGDTTVFEQTTREIDLAAMCAELSTLLDPNAQHLISYSDKLLQGDPVVMRIVLRGVIDHAITRNPDQALMIDIKVQDAKGGWLMFTVDDNGTSAIRLQDVSAFPSENNTNSDLYGIRKLLGAREGNLRISSGRDGIGTKVLFSMPGTIEQKNSESDMTRFLQAAVA